MSQSCKGHIWVAKSDLKEYQQGKESFVGGWAGLALGGTKEALRKFLGDSRGEDNIIYFSSEIKGCSCLKVPESTSFLLGFLLFL